MQSLFQALSSWGWTKKKGLSKRINEGGLRKWRKQLFMWKTVDRTFHYKNRLRELQKPLSQDLDILGRFLASSFSWHLNIREILQTVIKDETQLGQTMLALYLIDNKWGNWQSVESTVKTNQSEGIAAPTIPEEGHLRKSYRLSHHLSPYYFLVVSLTHPFSFRFFPNYWEPGTG